MPGRVTLDDSEMRARLRPLRQAAPRAAYVPRPAPEPSRKLFQDVSEVQAFEFPANFTQQQAQTVVGIETTPPRQVYSVAPRKPEPSKVLMRTSFVVQSQQPAGQPEAIAAPVRTTIENPFAASHAVAQPFVPRTFAPPVSQKRRLRIKVPRKPGVLIVRLKRTVWAMPMQQRMLTGLAAFVLIAGSGITLSGHFANKDANIRAAKASLAAATSATTTGSGNSAPSTADVTADTLRAYKVAPDAARYITIPKLGVLSRVLQVGLTKDGAMAVPANVYDTAWYKGSAKPGQPGATVIDGHVSSWTTNGVFYGIKNLAAGDPIGLELGDGKKLEYTVVKTVTYDVNAVDMQALMKTATVGKSGLNLITCGGKYDSKSGEFTQRIAVFATLND